LKSSHKSQKNRKNGCWDKNQLKPHAKSEEIKKDSRIEGRVGARYAHGAFLRNIDTPRAREGLAGSQKNSEKKKARERTTTIGGRGGETE